MSTTLNPNYFSKSAELNKYCCCSLCNSRLPKTDIRMYEEIEICDECIEYIDED